MYYLSPYLDFIIPYLRPPQANELATGNSSEEDAEGPGLRRRFKEEEISYDDKHIQDPLTNAHTVSTLDGNARKLPLLEIHIDDKQRIEYSNKQNDFDDSTHEMPTASTSITNYVPTTSSTNPMHYFFLSLMPEFDTMTENQTRIFKIKVLQVLDEIINT